MTWRELLSHLKDIQEDRLDDQVSLTIDSFDSLHLLKVRTYGEDAGAMEGHLELYI